MKKIFGVLGLGRFGSAIVKTLAENDYEVIAVDSNEEHLIRVEEHLTKGVLGDITDFSLLEAIGLADCDAVVIATGSTLESSVLALMHCKKLGIKKIIAKAQSRSYREILEEMGVTQVVMPEKEAGIRIAKKMMRTNIEDIVNLDDEISLIEFHPPKSWIGKTVQELDLRNRYDINIIGLRKDPNARIELSITSEQVIQENILLVGISQSGTFESQDFRNTLI